MIQKLTTIDIPFSPEGPLRPGGPGKPSNPRSPEGKVMLKIFIDENKSKNSIKRRVFYFLKGKLKIRVENFMEFRFMKEKLPGNPGNPVIPASPLPPFSPGRPSAPGTPSVPGPPLGPIGPIVEHICGLGYDVYFFIINIFTSWSRFPRKAIYSWRTYKI